MGYRFANRTQNLKASAIREILKFTADPAVISFAAGNPAPEAFPTAEFARISNELLQTNPIAALQYSITEGYVPLREYVKDYLLNDHHIGTAQDDLIIVSGAQQGTELFTKVMCDPGDTILCENPSFIGSLNTFKSYDVNLVGVPLQADGIDVDKLRQALEQHRNTKFIYLIPNFQNPSGITMSLEKRKAVYALAQAFDVMILEDNPYGELRFSGQDVPSIKSFDTDDRVVYLGSFSKVLSPGIRVGYVCAHKDVIQKMVVCKQVSDVHTNIWAQMVSCEFLLQNDLQAHLQRLREIYQRKCQLMLDNMDRYFSDKITYTRPEGGLFIWCTLPDGCDVNAFCTTAVQHKVATVPGTAFLPNQADPTHSFRLNFSTPTDEQIVAGIKILGDLTRQLF